MSFDSASATKEQIQARLDKFKRRAKHITDQEHFDSILKSFPADERETVFAEVKTLVPFDVRFQV